MTKLDCSVKIVFTTLTTAVVRGDRSRWMQGEGMLRNLLRKLLRK